MKYLSDAAVAHLREIAERPDLHDTRYELVRELGRGGVGVVYEVHDRELERNVAMKVIEEEWRGEARIIAGLEHPGIVPVHDAGALPDGRFYYTMKLVRGTRLDHWSREKHGLTESLRLFARICEPIAFAHARGAVHRDLKPQNIMVGELGEVLVMDWGIVGVGTPGYMAPEQELGTAPGPRSDVYALGILLASLTDSNSVERRLAAVIARARSKNPEDRYATAAELARDILSYLDGQPISAYRETAFDHAERWVAGNRVLLALLAAYLVMRVLALLWMQV